MPAARYTCVPLYLNYSRGKRKTSWHSALARPQAGDTNTMPGRTETVPCQVPIKPQLPLTPTLTSFPRSQYKTGKTLGEGTYSVIKEAVSIKTGAFYACKIIDKKLMNGREYLVGSFPQSIILCVDYRPNPSQVKNEISALKKVSKSHRNIITLHDYFEVLSMSFRYHIPTQSSVVHLPSDYPPSLPLLRSLHWWRTV